MTAASLDIDRAPVIIGGGLAGLMTALRLAPMPVVVLAKAPLGAEASSGWAQGGIAAAVGPDDDPELHLADTLAAGDGLCHVEVVRRITAAAPAAIASRPRLSAPVASRSKRTPLWSSVSMRALAQAVRATPSITVLEGLEARRLLVADGGISGVLATSPSGSVLLPTARVVIATGGVGGLFLHSTNPRGSFGQGLALAARAGATLVDMEFVQFHPTALDTDASPLPLISEAVRGEGATLIDETGARLMDTIPGKELAPRDVVARAVWRHMSAGHRVFLDARLVLGTGFARHFPVIATSCAAAGIDPATQPMPIRPAAHYHMGGIEVDAAGRSSVRGLWACGEEASTGLHGANRLASNSLLEAVVCAGWVADSLAGTPAGQGRPHIAPELPPPADPTPIRPILSCAAGVASERQEPDRSPFRRIAPSAAGRRRRPSAHRPHARSACEAPHRACRRRRYRTGDQIVVAARQRRESRGAHFRADTPRSEPSYEKRLSLTLAATLRAAHSIAPQFLESRRA